jgi:ribosomal protein S24E
MKIIKQEKSNLLPRIDIVANVEHINKRTPSNEEVKKELSKLMKVDEELILIKHIYDGYGSGVSRIEAYAYNSKEDIALITKKGKKEKEKEAKAIEDAQKAAEETKKKAEEDAQAKVEKTEEPAVEETTDVPVEENKVEEKDGKKTSEE